MSGEDAGKAHGFQDGLEDVPAYLVSGLVFVPHMVLMDLEEAEGHPSGLALRDKLDLEIVRRGRDLAEMRSQAMVQSYSLQKRT